MIIENRWFILTGPRRADLSGRPWGFLFIWLPRDYPMAWQDEAKFDDITIPGQWVRKEPGRFAPRPSSGFRVGFYLDLYHPSSHAGRRTAFAHVTREATEFYNRRWLPVPRFTFGKDA